MKNFEFEKLESKSEWRIWMSNNNPILSSTEIEANLEEMGLTEFSSRTPDVK